MIRGTEPTIAERAKQIYADRLETQLQADYPNKFVAIEPDSGDFFIGETLSEAIGKSREKYPDRLAHALRVGHKTAVHFGMRVQ